MNNFVKKVNPQNSIDKPKDLRPFLNYFFLYLFPINLYPFPIKIYRMCFGYSNAHRGSVQACRRCATSLLWMCKIRPGASTQSLFEKDEEKYSKK